MARTTLTPVFPMSVNPVHEKVYCLGTLNVVTDKDILVQARAILECGRTDYICHSIEQARGGREKQKLELKEWVAKMLEGHSTYFSWLKKKHPKILKKAMPGDIRIARLQWLDWMIENCDKPKEAV